MVKAVQHAAPMYVKTKVRTICASFGTENQAFGLGTILIPVDIGRIARKRSVSRMFLDYPQLQIQIYTYTIDRKLGVMMRSLTPPHCARKGKFEVQTLNIVGSW